MKNKILLASIMLLSLNGFSQSKKEKEANRIIQQHKTDSINTLSNKYKMQLIELRSQLTAQEQLMTDTKKFHIGRTEETKMKEIQKVDATIQMLKTNIETIEAKQRQITTYVQF